MNGLAQYCRLALDRRVVLRALRVACVVGSILIVINQGDVLKIDTRSGDYAERV